MKSTKPLLLLILVMTCFLLASCSGGTQPATDSSGTANPSDQSPSSSADPAGETVFRMARSHEDNSCDPAMINSPTQIALTAMIYETLCKQEKDMSCSPLLAESWDISDDGLIYTFHLRQGVQWHHGYGEFTSADVKFSFERHLDPDLGSMQQDALALSKIDAIETPDPYTVIFKLNKPEVDFLNRCASFSSYIVSEAAYSDRGVDALALFPIGTGPLQFDKGMIGSQTEAIAFDQYWGTKPKVDRFISMIIPDDTTAFTAFENGELDMVMVDYSEKAFEFKDKGYNIFSIPLNQLLYVGVNVQMAPWDNPKVREAFYHCIDPEYYLAQLHHGMESYSGGYIPPNSKYALTDYLQPAYDPEKSKALLAEAGYPNGVKITMWAVNDEYIRPPALIAQSQLTDGGFDVELQLVDYGVYINTVRAGEAQTWVLYNNTPPLADETINRYTSSFYPGNNWLGFQDKTYDDLVAKGLAATSEEEKTAYLYDAQKYLIDSHAIYGICTSGSFEVAQPYVSGVELWGDFSIRIENVEINK